jgi:hypothetical protein
MRCLVLVMAVFCLLLSAADLRQSDAGRVPLVRAASLQAQPSRTELMQQSDHKQRVDNAKKAKTEERQIATAGIPESRAGDYDYLVLAILVGSVIVLAVVAGRKRRARLRI